MLDSVALLLILFSTYCSRLQSLRSSTNARLFGFQFFDESIEVYSEKV